MKQIIALLFLAFTMICTGCKKEDVSLQLNGTWVEAKDKSDTIVFRNDGRFDLNRGKEMRNGHLLPKYGSGSYEYKVSADSIALYNGLSSCYCFKDYYFEVQNGTIRIGDFYRKDVAQSEILLFIKQK